MAVMGRMVDMLGCMLVATRKLSDGVRQSLRISSSEVDLVFRSLPEAEGCTCLFQIQPRSYLRKAVAHDSLH